MTSPVESPYGYTTKQAWDHLPDAYKACIPAPNPSGNGGIHYVDGIMPDQLRALLFLAGAVYDGPYMFRTEDHTGLAQQLVGNARGGPKYVLDLDAILRHLEKTDA